MRCLLKVQVLEAGGAQAENAANADGGVQQNYAAQYDAQMQYFFSHGEWHAFMPRVGVPHPWIAGLTEGRRLEAFIGNNGIYFFLSNPPPM